MEGELEQRAAVVQGEGRMGALEVGLAAMVQHADEIMSEIKLQRLWVDGELKECVLQLAVQDLVHQVEGRMPELAAVQEKVEVRIENTEGDLNRAATIVRGVDSGTWRFRERPLF